MKPLVDLTMTIREDMMVYPGHPPTSVDLVKNFRSDGREVRRISMSCHAGTHLDAPRHFFRTGGTADNILIEKLVGLCAINRFDVSAKKAWKIQRRMMLCTGWYKNYGRENYYRDSPYLSRAEAMEFVRAGVEVILLDFPSPDRAGECGVHEILLEANIVIVEYLTNTDSIRKYDMCEIFVGPLKIQGADGAPCRVLARPL